MEAEAAGVEVCGVSPTAAVHGERNDTTADNTEYFVSGTEALEVCPLHGSPWLFERIGELVEPTLDEPPRLSPPPRPPKVAIPPPPPAAQPGGPGATSEAKAAPVPKKPGFLVRLFGLGRKKP